MNPGYGESLHSGFGEPAALLKTTRGSPRDALQMSGDWRAAAEAWRDWLSLQPQMEVLRLLADGLRNAEIANALFISPKTVDHHVSAILSKLGAQTRAEAVSLVLQSGLVTRNKEL